MILKFSRSIFEFFFQGRSTSVLLTQDIVIKDFVRIGKLMLVDKRSEVSLKNRFSQIIKFFEAESDS